MKPFASFLVAACALSALLSIPAGAEIVQHTYSGVVTTVTNGSGGSLDLTGTFSAGQPVMIAISIERTIHGIPYENGGTIYLSAITGWTFSIGSYVCPPGPNSLSGTIVGNNLPSPPVAANLTMADAVTAVADYFDQNIPGPLHSPMIGNAVSQYLRVDLVDSEATVFADEQIPSVMPDLSEFESKTWSLSFYDAGLNKTGKVSGTLLSDATPASSSTWGRIKAEYRN